MIASDEYLKKICRNYEQVENYDKAVADKEIWDLHHRREIDEMKSAKQLQDEGRYYNLEPEELIFLTKSDHRKLHNLHNHPMRGKHHSNKTKKKISEALTGKESQFKGKQHSKDVKKKMSEAHKGKKLSNKHRNKISDALTGEKNPMFGKPGTMLGRHWWNNGIINISSKDCPGEDFVLGRLIKWKCR